MKIYLIRHAQRDFGINFDKLRADGIEQAKRLGLMFKDVKIDLIYCSPQFRARQTLSKILPYLNKKIPVKISSYVRQKSSPEEVGPSAMRLYNLKRDTDEQLRVRVIKFIQILKHKYSEKTILVVTHKEFIRQFVKLFVPKYKDYETKDIEIKSASISSFEFDNRFNLVRYDVNNCEHLVL